MVYKINDEKEIKIPDSDIQRLIDTMNISQEEAIQIWLEDEGLVINEEQEALCKKAKENRVTATIHNAKATEKGRAKRVVQKKENPIKKAVIDNLYQALLPIAENVVIENDTKIITFTIGEESFKLDLIQKRKGKQ